VDVRFGGAMKQYRLIKALWNAKTKRPAKPRKVQTVIDAVYGRDNDTSDSAFRQLISDTRKKLQAENCPIDIETLMGQVQLKPLRTPQSP
jgi:DNA-binding response OmpR family regulator